MSVVVQFQPTNFAVLLFRETTDFMSVVIQFQPTTAIVFVSERPPT